jgi:type II secretory pathway component PulJ
MEQLSTTDCFLGAFRSILDGWFYGLEEDVLAEGTIDPADEKALSNRADELLEQRLAEITRATPQFAAALRAYRAAQRANDHATAEGLAGWLAGQPHVAASVKRVAGVKGDVDHFAALSFLRGLLLILKDSGYSGLVLVLDEIETLQRVRGDVREKGLNALRQLIDDIDGGRFPNLYLMTTEPRRSSMAPKVYGVWNRWLNVCMWTSRRTPVLTIPVQCNFVSRPSTSNGCSK